MIGAYEQLANAIIIQAVKDYRFALRRLAKYPRNSSALYTKKESENFFRSEYFIMITSVDPEILIQKLHEEVVRR